MVKELEKARKPVKKAKKAVKKAVKKAKLKAKEIKNLSELIKNGDTVILEQTGTYGLSYAKRIEQLGATVLIADGKEFKRFRNGR